MKSRCTDRTLTQIARLESEILMRLLPSRWTPKILPKGLFSNCDGLSHCNRIYATAVLPPLIISVVKFGSISIFQKLCHTPLYYIACKRHVLKIVGFWAASAIS